MAKLNKKILTFEKFMKSNYGEDSLITADKFVDRPRTIIPTVLSLDIALNGGIPEGKIVLFSGRPKAGKTSATLTILANAQKLGRKTFYMDIERRCDPRLLDTIQGLDKSNLQFIQSSYDKLLSAQDWLEILYRTISDNEKSVIVVDSIAALSTLVEQSEEVGSNKDMAGVPKLLASFFRKTAPIIDNNNCIVIFISQYQTNRNAYGPKFSDKGGMAIQYACSVWLNVDWVERWVKDDNIGAPRGHNIKLKVITSALGPPLLPCDIPLRYGNGIDISMDVINQCENLGIIEKGGSWYTIPSLNNKKIQGKESLIEYLNKNTKDRDILESKAREIMIPEKS